MDGVHVKVFEDIDKTVNQSKELKNKFKQDVNKKQMDDILFKVESYSKAFERYVDSENKKNNLMKNMREKAWEAIDMV